MCINNVCENILMCNVKMIIMKIIMILIMCNNNNVILCMY